jgi:hypothetical protein
MLTNETALDGQALKDALESGRAIVKCPGCGSTRIAQYLIALTTQTVNVWTASLEFRDDTKLDSIYSKVSTPTRPVEWEARDEDPFVCLDCDTDWDDEDLIITVRPPLYVDIYHVDQSTGAETLNASNVPLTDCFEEHEIEDIVSALSVSRETHVGGGAAPLVRITPTVEAR